MVSLTPFSLLLALVLSVHAASFQDSSPREPEDPLDAQRPVGIMTLPAKLPDDWPRPVTANPETGGKQKGEETDSKTTTDNRPVIKPLTNVQSPHSSSFDAAPSRQPERPTREITTPRPSQKPQQKPQPLPAHSGLNGNRQGLTKPAPTPAKPAQSNTQKPHAQPAQTGLAGNRQGLTKPAPLPAHARPQRHALDEEPKPQPFPAIPSTQKPQVLPAPIGNEKPNTQPAIPDGERPAFRPPPAGTLRPQTIPAYVGSTVKPQPLPAIIDPRPPFVAVDPVPPHLASPSPADRPHRETSLSSTSSEENKPQTLPALASPLKPQTPQTLPPVGTLPVFPGNRDSLLRPAPLPAQMGSS